MAHGSLARRVMTEANWPFEVCAVETLGEWRRRGFAQQVDEIDALLDGYVVAVGHGYDAWVLMAAAEQRAARGAAVPFLLLLNAVLGSSQHLNGALLGYRAPRGPRVRAAFGLDRDGDGHRSLIEKVTYVFGDNDCHSSPGDWSYLRGLGSRVHVICGWHQRHRTSVEEQLRDILVDYACEVAQAIAADVPPVVVNEDDPVLSCAAVS